MRSPILLAPTLIELALMAALWSRVRQPAPDAALTPAERSAEIRALHKEKSAISSRLSVLESQGQQFLPRGGEPVHSTRSGD